MRARIVQGDLEAPQDLAADGSVVAFVSSGAFLSLGEGNNRVFDDRLTQLKTLGAPEDFPSLAGNAGCEVGDPI